MILICISLVISNVEHLFKCLLEHLKCQYRFSPHILIRMLVLMILSYMSCL